MREIWIFWFYRTSLSSASHPRIKNQILATLEEFLVDEEERMSKASKNRSTIATKNEGDDDEENINADSGISCVSVRRMLSHVLIC